MRDMMKFHLKSQISRIAKAATREMRLSSSLAPVSLHEVMGSTNSGRRVRSSGQLRALWADIHGNGIAYVAGRKEPMPRDNNFDDGRILSVFLDRPAGSVRHNHSNPFRFGAILQRLWSRSLPRRFTPRWGWRSNPALKRGDNGRIAKNGAKMVKAVILAGGLAT